MTRRCKVSESTSSIGQGAQGKKMGLKLNIKTKLMTTSKTASLNTDNQDISGG